jgi:hypothetical protein
VRARTALALALALLGLALGPGQAVAAEPPQVGAAWVTEVTASGATLRAEINPEGALTRYRFEYLSQAAYEANLAASPPREGFSGALKVPLGTEPGIGAGNSPETVNQHVGGLSPLSAYRYRVRASSAQGTAFSSEVPLTHAFTTQGTELTFSLLDHRGWEMVSPVDKNGGAITSVGTTAPRVFQAAADGQSATYNSISSFSSPEGAPSVSQYLSKRGAGGWSAEDVTIPLFSGSYGDEPTTTPYQLFSGDLSHAIVLNGRRCRGEEGQCPVANPPLPGSGAPPAYINYYRRDSAGGFTALLTGADVEGPAVAPENFEVAMVAASPDLGRVVLSTCAALTPDATEFAGGPGTCDAGEPNLYEWSGSGLELINVLPGQSQGTPGAEVAAQGQAVSEDGAVYWVDPENVNLYLHRPGQGSVQVDTAAGGAGTFQTAGNDGGVAYFSKEGRLYRYVLATETATDLTPGGEVEGVLGVSADGAYLYFLTPAGLQLWHNGTTTPIAAGADSSNYPPSTGTARVTPDGTHLAFLSSASLTGYDNAGRSEVFLYGPPPGGGTATLTCVSCNPTGERPDGRSSIPGAVANGEGSTAIAVYKPRSLSADGARVFFDTEDALVVQDTDLRPDVYEWEAPGAGSCAVAGGCLGLISSGRSGEGASFVDASSDGSDAFFLTDGSLVPADPGSVDLYDARVGGGFAVAPAPVPCVGDACQPLPPAPEDPTPGTLVPNPGNPVQPKPKKKTHKPKKHHKKHGKGKRK